MVPTVAQEVEVKCSLTGDKTTRLRGGESRTKAEGGSRSGVELDWSLSASSQLLWGCVATRGSGQKEGTPPMGRWGRIELLQPSIKMSTKVMGTKLAEPRVITRSTGIY